MRLLRPRVGLIIAVCLAAVSIVVWAQVDTPTQVSFTCSADQATLTGYQVRSVVDATSVASAPVSVGVPTPVLGVCTVSISTSGWTHGVEYRIEVRSVRGSSVSAWVETARTGVVPVGPDPPPPVDPNAYYVATTGLDSRSCATAQDITTPKRTFAGAMVCLTAGSTLYVRTGTYAESLINTVPSGTSWTNKVRIAAYAGETVWLTPSAGAQRVINFSRNQQYIEFDGINLDGTNVTYDIVKIEGWSGGNAHHIRIQNAELKGTAVSNGQHRQHILLTGVVAGIIGYNEFINLTMHGHGLNDFDHGFYVQSGNNLIEGCTLYNISGAGVHFYSAYGIPFYGNIVRDNVVRDGRLGAAGQRGWGILSATMSRDTQIYNNIVYNIRNSGSGSGAIYLGLSNASGAKVYHNTVYGNAAAGIRIDSPYSGAVIKNNISYGNSGSNYTNGGTGTSASNNLIGVNPLFVNAVGGNFHLLVGSPAISAGVAVGVSTDYDGVARGTPPDIGAYEYVP